MGLVSFGEPFTRLFNQGVIIAEKQKMSKSRGNVVTPDGYVSELGADAVRAYLMFIGPWEQGGEWNDSGISGISRWLNRVWSLVTAGYKEGGKASPADKEQAPRALSRVVHQTIRKVTDDLERLRFNTMVAALMEFTNYLTRVKEEGVVSLSQWGEAIDILLLLLAPACPHITEELWQQRAHDYSIHNQSWPKWDEALAREEETTLVVQVNGKLRDRIMVPPSITEAEAKEKALGSQKVKVHLKDKEIIKTIYVPGRLVNIVVG
jgi:leucyl-tRNA synthetase